ncbi:MAG: adenosylmethionine--8-amino-7-oxononanoate transaminase [Endomicrobiales bacterium]
MDDRRKIDLVSWDKKYIWHPFTQMADWAKDRPSRPLVIASGDGVYLKDRDGKRYIDGVSSLWVTVHGHRKKEIDRAVARQLGKIAHTTFLGLTHEPAIRLAKALVELAPEGLSRVFYSDNGSTSVEVAMKMAYQYWLQGKKKTGKNRFLSLVNAYHGDTIGAVSVGGMELFHAKFKPLLFKALHAPSPSCYRCAHRTGEYSFGETSGDFSSHCRRMGCGGECLAETERILARHHRETAAAVIEPMMQGAAGMLAMPPGYLKRFAALCRRYGVLLICDEVATGFGRTGRMFAVEHEGVRPDLLCLSKGITGGYLPLAATLATEKVYRAFLGRHEEFKIFFHGHTYTANPLGCAAALASLELFRKERIIKKLPEKIAHLKKELSTLVPLPCVGDIRQLGMMAGIELVKDRASRAEFHAGENIGARVCAAARPRGLIIRPLGAVLVLMPPLSITPREITKMISAVRASIQEAVR